MNFKTTIASLLIIFSTDSIAREPIMSYEEYAQIKHGRPYMYTLLKQDQVLFYFGANHSCDPENEQYQFFDYFWDEFLQCTKGENCVVLIEDSLRGVRNNRYDAITRGGGEGGLLQFLAAQEKITAMCPEPDQQVVREQLLKTFTADEIDYLHFAQIGLMFHRYRKINQDLEFASFYQKYKPTKSLDEMKVIHAQIFGTEFDASDERFFYNVSNPVDSRTVVNGVARATSKMRDEVIVDRIGELIAQGKNVFIAYGATHAVMQKAAIKSLWDTEKI